MQQTESPSPGQQYRRLLDTYGIPEERRLGWLAEMADAFGNYPLAALTAATTTYIKRVAVPAEQYHEVPTPGTFAPWVYRAMEDAEREEQKALPPPPKPRDGWDAKTGPERTAFLERHLAIGVLRAQAGKTDLNVPFEANEHDVAGVMGHNRARRFCFATLERIAGGETVTPAELVAAGAARKGGRPITDAERAAAYERRGIKWPGLEGE